MRKLRISSGLALFGLVATFLVAGTTVAAQAATPGQAVTADASVGSVQWRTPAVMAKHVRIASHPSGDGVSTVMTLADSHAPNTYSFPLDLPAGSVAGLFADGSVAVQRHGSVLGSFLPPWAKDATGRALPTRYELSGTPSTGYVLTQHITTDGAAYPITADPHWSRSWYSPIGTLYFNKGETHNIASGSSVALAAVVGGCTLAGGPVAGVVCAAAAGQFYFQANRAWNLRQCLKVRLWVAGYPSFLGAYVYSGGYCK